MYTARFVMTNKSIAIHADASFAKAKNSPQGEEVGAKAAPE